jgi:hypothetical protein
MLARKASYVCRGERRQSFHLGRADLGSQRIQDGGYRRRPSRFVVGLSAAVTLGRGDEGRARIGHANRVAQLPCGTFGRCDTVLRNRES